MDRSTMPTRFELIDSDGNSHSSYDTAYAAAAAGRLFWPDQEQDPDRTGKGWDVQVAGAK